MLPTSHYDKRKADRVVTFINNLKHTKGSWAGLPFELIWWQEELIRNVFGVIKANGYRQFQTAFVETSKKSGKALAIDTPIPNPNGFIPMGDIKVGDMVFDENGEPCSVLAVSEIMKNHICYRVSFSDGGSIVADASWFQVFLGNAGQASPESRSSIKEKVQQHGFCTAIRIGSSGKNAFGRINDILCALKTLESAGVRIYAKTEKAININEAHIPWCFPLKMSVKELSHFLLLSAGDKELAGTASLHFALLYLI